MIQSVLGAKMYGAALEPTLHEMHEESRWLTACANEHQFQRENGNLLT